MMDCEERQKQVYGLSSFITEQEKWLEDVLGKLQWTKEYISSVCEKKDTGGVVTTLYRPVPIFLQANASFEQCPYNAGHYVPSSSLESHKAKCCYSNLGIKMDSETSQSVPSTRTFYSESNIPHVLIGMSYSFQA